MRASDVLNTPPVYIGNMVSGAIGKRTTYTNNAATAFKLPEDMPENDKLNRIKKYNKTTGGTSKITTSRDRPKLTDTEITLILASQAHTPYEILATILNTNVSVIKNVVLRYSNNAIPQMPLVMVSDTSRYWDKDVERPIDTLDELNNIEDPLTTKELLRGATNGKYNKTTNGEHQNKKNNRRPHESNIASIGYLERECFKTTTGYTTGLVTPYNVIVNKKQIFIKDVKLPRLFNYTINKVYNTFNIKPNTQSDILLLNNLNAGMSRILKLDNYKSSEVRKGQYVVYNTKLSNKYQTVQYSTHFNTLKSISKLKNFNNTTHSVYTFTDYNLIKPHLHDRSHASPILDNKGNLRYRLPSNVRYNNFNVHNLKSKIRITVVCNRCNTKLYNNTTQAIKCCCQSQPIIVDYIYVRKHLINKHKPLRYPKLGDNLRTYYDYYRRNNSTLRNNRQYSYITGRQRHKGTVRPDIKQVVSIYTDHDNYSLLIDSIDVKPLYVNFEIPIDTNMSEPTHL